MGNEYQNRMLAHSGVKGQKWGVRRYETEDGHLTEAGKQRYLGKISKTEKKREKLATKIKKNEAKQKRVREEAREA